MRRRTLAAMSSDGVRCAQRPCTIPVSGNPSERSAVMAAIVLDIEMSVGHRGERDLGEPALPRILLVTKFMGRVDGDAVDRAHADDEARILEPAARFVGCKPSAPERREELAWDVEDNDDPVIPVGFELGDRPIGRIAVVLADDEIEQRNHQIDDDRRDPGIDRQVGFVEMMETIDHEKG